MRHRALPPPSPPSLLPRLRHRLPRLLRLPPPRPRRQDRPPSSPSSRTASAAPTPPTPPSSSESAPRSASGPTLTTAPMSFWHPQHKRLARMPELLRPQPRPYPLPLVSSLPHQARQSRLSDLADHLRLALDLPRKAAASSRRNVYRSMQLAGKMEKLDRWIAHWLKRQMPTHVLADVHHLHVEFAVHLDRIGCHIQEGTTMMRPVAVGVTEVMEGLEFGRGSGEASPPVGAAVRVGKERVREMLMATGGGAEVVGICGIGGSGNSGRPRSPRRFVEITRFEV